MGSTIAPLKEEDGIMPHAQMVLPAGDFSWSEATLPSPSPTENTWTGYISTASSQGQLSPMSSNTDTMNYHMAAGTGFPSYAGHWQDGTASQREQATSGTHLIPKIEPDDDMTSLDHVQTSPSITSTQPQKRPRGRPRKHPIVPPLPAGSKITKGRSKTGCITCRKRKKKCDEAKPKCNNCEKNAVVCEGYHEKQVWKSGRERAEEAERLKIESLAPVLLQSIFDGVETDEDKILWRHYVNHLSNVMTIEGDSRNAFKDILLHLANQHQGVMHSILSFSGAHLDLESPYGQELLHDHAWLSADILDDRAEYHRSEALKFLCEDINSTVDKDSQDHETIVSARYAQMLCFLLQTLVDGKTQGEHRLHLQGYKSLMAASPPEDPTFGAFITELFQYYICADDLLWHPSCQQRRVASDDWDSSTPIAAPRLFGIADGLFIQLSRISTVRNAIRANIEADIEPPTDHMVLSRAAEIDAVINSWQPQTSYEDSRGRIGMLYKQCLWLYLYRTVYPPQSSHVRRSALGSLPMAGTSSMIAPTTQRRSSIATSIVSSPAPVAYCNGSHSTSRNPSRSSSMHETDGMVMSDMMSASRSSSPALTTSARSNQKISFSVNQSLDVLESFNPNDPAQTLLLIPCLLVGTSCFEAAQRDRIRIALRHVREYTGVRSCDRVSQLLEEVWSRMDHGDLMAVWDWQATSAQMELDFLCK